MEASYLVRKSVDERDTLKALHVELVQLPF